MKQFIIKFFYFLLFFIIKLIGSAVFKPNMVVLTSFSVALGGLFGLAFIENYIGMKSL